MIDIVLFSGGMEGGLGEPRLHDKTKTILIPNRGY